MVRWIASSLVAALILSLGVSGAEAAKGNKNGKNAEKRVSGEIQAVNGDQTVLTVSAGKGQGKKGKKGDNVNADNPAKGKKGKGKDGPTQEIRVTPTTFVEYVGIDDQDAKKFQKGYYVVATLADDGTAKTLSVSKAPLDAGNGGKKGKKNKNA